MKTLYTLQSAAEYFKLSKRHLTRVCVELGIKPWQPQMKNGCNRNGGLKFKYFFGPIEMRKLSEALGRD